jgi:hypothetical protein
VVTRENVVFQVTESVQRRRAGDRWNTAGMNRRLRTVAPTGVRSNGETMSAITAPAIDIDIDEVRVREAAELRHRATQLRRQAARLDDVLATSYRRRASELEMQAWVTELQAGVPDSKLRRAA